MSQPFPPITLSGTEVRKLPAKNLDQDFRLSLYLPPGYADTEQSYPVVYFLDAYLWGAIFPEIARTLQFGREIPEIILVGIEADTDDFRQWAEYRTKNLSPTIGQDENIPYETGGGAEFYSFIKEEIIPFVEKTYRVTAGDRTLVGSSIGGLFVLYVLFNHQDDFNNYFVFSPTLYWDDRVTFKYEAAYAENNTDLPAKLFLAVGGEEDMTPINRLNPERQYIPALEHLKTALNNRNYKNLKLYLSVLQDESHTSVCPPAFSRGLKWVFGRKSIAARMIQTFLEKDIQTAIEEYHRLKETQFDEYNFDEPELNNLGYSLLYSDNSAEAIEILKLNIEAYPQSANIFDSLGEAYLAINDTQKAMDYYQKALEVDPNTPSAISALKKLNPE